MNPSSKTPHFLLFMLFNAKIPVHSPLKKQKPLRPKKVAKFPQVAVLVKQNIIDLV